LQTVISYTTRLKYKPWPHGKAVMAVTNL